MRRTGVIALVAAGVVATVSAPATAGTDHTIGMRDQAALDRLDRVAQISFHASSRKVRFVGTTAGRPLPSGLPATASPAAVARAFFSENGRLFGITDQAIELRVRREQSAPRGRSVVRLRQVHRGVPVLAGELVVNVDAARDILSVSGETIPFPKLSVEPTIGASRAVATAEWLVENSYGVPRASLQATTPALWIYDSELMGTPGPAERVLVWRTEVTSTADAEVRELVLVNAVTGELTLNFSQIAHAKNRQICDAGNAQARVPCNAPYQLEEGGVASAVTDVNDAYDFSGLVYDFFNVRFARDSIDNAGMPLKQTVRYCEGSCPFENAFWDGEQMVYGPGYASADDVVGHEMVHGITERTSGLFYWFQAGAINESFSDVFGELFDQTSALRSNDTTAVKWLMGEDLPGGAIRSMSDPPAYQNPDKMSSPWYFDGTDGFGTIEDNGGVHYNSGVNNKAAYLMTDGGSFNGRTITGLGIAKVAAIYYEVGANLLTSGSDYADLYNALLQACQNLVGTRSITAADCTQVENAALAVEMNLQPFNNPNIFPSVPDAPVCPTGQIPTDFFYDNMETTTSNWGVSTIVGSNRWTLTTGYAHSGRLALYTPDQESRSDASVFMQNGVALPLGTTYLRFDHALSWEGFLDFSTFSWHNLDGGVVEYSVNGSTWTDAGPLFTHNGYVGPLSTVSDNPLEGRQAFTGTSGGYSSSRASLSMPAAGNSVRFRFRAGTDTGTPPGFFGWVIDDVRIYTCAVGSRPAGSAANLLRNPGFEWDDDANAFPDSWRENTGALRMNTPRRSGQYSMRLQAADLDDNSTSQKVGVAAGSSFVASAWVNIPTTTKAVDFAVQVEWLNASSSVLSTQNVRSFTTHTSGAWANATATLTAPAAATAARLGFVQRAPESAAFVDDADFHASPPVDTTPPDTTISSGPSGTITTSSATFAFTSTESGSTFECSLNADPFAACTSPKAYTGLANGPYTFQVRATDAAGNTDASPASRMFTVDLPEPDTTPPNTTITSGPAKPIKSTSATFGFASTEPGSTFECELIDTASFEVCSSPETYTGLADGSYTFRVRARDAAGNVDPTPASRTFSVDTVKPNTRITAGPKGTVTAAKATFRFRSSEAGSRFQCKLDAGRWSKCTSPKTYLRLTKRLHTFRVRAIDAAGNVDPTPAIRSWRRR